MSRATVFCILPTGESKMTNQKLNFALAVACLAAGLSAQMRLHTAVGTAEDDFLGRYVAGAGDLDGDGLSDFLVTQRPRLHAVSGATGSTIYTIDPATNPHVIGDINGDGKRDFVVSSNGTKIFSGADGSFIRSHAGPPASCNVGDFNLDGTDDYAIAVSFPGTTLIAVHSGLDGSQLTLGNAWNGSPQQILPVGDLTEDGQTEIVVAITGQPVVILDLNPHAVLGQLDWSGSKTGFARRIAVGDVDVDGQLDVAVLAPAYLSRGGVLVFSTTTQQTIRSYKPTHARSQDSFADIGDLNRDGAMDFAIHSTEGIYFVNGLTGGVLSRWTEGFDFYDNKVTNAGDVDGDGFDDLLISQWDVSVAGVDDAGRWLLISSGILATREAKANICYGGAFQPELGMTRPIIGKPLTVSGRNAPMNTAGVVLIGLAGSTNLGVAGCDTWVNPFSQSLLLLTPSAPNWSQTFHVPLIPQLAGVTFALQGGYFPTDGPMGFDLTNGIWAKFGY